MANGRGGLLSAGGILSIIVGAFEVIGGGVIATLTRLGIALWQRLFPFFPGFGGRFGMAAIPAWLIIVGAILAVLGIVAIVGGISAIRRSSFGLSLAGGYMCPSSHQCLWGIGGYFCIPSKGRI